MSSSAEMGELMNKMQNIVTEQELHGIIKQTTNQIFKIIDHQTVPASEDGPKGFVGDHFKMTVNVEENNRVRKIHLFMKTLPLINKPKADMIVQNQFFKREALMFNLLKEIQEIEGQRDPNPWYSNAYLHNDKILVMPDLCAQGYKTYPVQKYLDEDHIFATVSAVARFHATFARYETQKKLDEPEYNFMAKHGAVVNEPPMAFCDSLWLRSGAKLSNNFLKEFSSKADHYPADLETKLCELFIKGCNTFKEYDDTLNVIDHKDLWAHNILFKYKGEEVKNAVLLDFQCIRYGPPAFDVMILLYLTTPRDFRERYETAILRYYFSVFIENVDDLTKKRMRGLSYDEDSFLIWCEKARKFGMVLPIMIFPFILMDPMAAQKAFDDPDTYVEHIAGDRSEVVISHARVYAHYRNRQLELTEEFVERFVVTT